MSGASDIFRQPWKPFKLKEEEGDLPLGYAKHVRGRIVRPGRVRLRPAPARRQTAPTKCSPAMRIRAALGAKEVTFKIISYGRDLDSVKRQLRYIARDGDVPLERAHGEIVEGDRAAIDEVAEEWSMGFHHHGGRARNSVHMMVSAPAGSDREAVEDAAREFAAQTFGANWDYVMARHDDTANPHVHIVAETRGMDGALFSLEPGDIQPIRERFADACRAEGLHVTATPRAVRAVMDRGEEIGVVKLRADGHSPERDHRQAAEADAIRERSMEERLIAHEARANRALAAELRETGSIEDLRAAQGLDGLAARADAVLDREAGETGRGGALDASAQVEEPSAPMASDDDARRAELAGLDHLAALERLTALRKRRYDELRARFSGLYGPARADALDSLRGYEREMDEAHAEMRALRGGMPEPDHDVPASRDADPPDRDTGHDRDDDRDRDDRDDDLER